MSRAGELQGLWERETRTELENVDSAMEFPFSIFIYEARDHSKLGAGREAVQKRVLSIVFERPPVLKRTN